MSDGTIIVVEEKRNKYNGIALKTMWKRLPSATVDTVAQGIQNDERNKGNPDATIVKGPA